MKTQLILTIEHPSDASPKYFIDMAIKPYINDINADCMEGWGLSMSQSPRFTYKHLRDYALMVSIEHHLCEVEALVHGGKSADDILEMVIAGDDSLVIWEHYEYDEPEELADSIEDQRGINLYNYNHVLREINGEEWLINFKGETEQ
jgi:hypothetical protein